MSTKRTTGRVGPFSHEHVEIDLSGPQPVDEKTILEVVAVLEASAPQGRIARLLPHAQRLDVGRELLDAARALIDPSGAVTNMHRFDALIARAELRIERAQNESLNVYGLAGRTARHAARLAKVATERNQSRSKEAQAINAALIARDDEIAEKHPTLSQVQRARAIINRYPEEVPGSMTAASLAKRIRNARK